jgi:peptide/nickel transport system substrate-binding protein
MKLHKKILSVLLAGVMLSGLALTACNKGGGNGGASSSHREVKNVEPAGQVVIGSSTEASGDWAQGTFNTSINATDSAVLTLTDGLATVTPDEGGSYIVNYTIVDNYERTEDADGNATYTFKIKDNLVFNDGTPIKAEHFLGWTLFSVGPVGQSMGAATVGWKQIPGGVDYKDGKVPYLAGLRLLGDYEFSVTISKTNSDGEDILPYYYDITNASFGPTSLTYWFGEGWHVKDDGQGAYLANDNGTEFSEAAIKSQFETARFATSNRVTSGAYNLVSFDKAANQITLEVNPNFPGDFNGQKPGIQKLVIVKAETATAVDTLKTGGFDLYSGITDGDQINEIVSMIDSGELSANFCKYDRAGYGYFCFQCDFGPTQFVEFRQAIAHLIDRNEFARSFCQGWGTPVHSAYATAFTMYKDSEELFAKEMDTYAYSLDEAVALLEKAGFTLNAEGKPFTPGTDELRYKKVTAEEAGTYEFNVTLGDGTILMPAYVNWACSEGNSVSDLLMTMLANGDATKQAGVKINQTAMEFDELLNWLYRDGTVDAMYLTPKYNMFNLATNYSSGVYDQSYNYTSDPELVAQGYNTYRIFDDELDKLSMDMVYGVTSDHYEQYLDLWQKFELRFNYLLPLVPLYSNTYISVYPTTIENYEEDTFFGYEKAILYARYIGK